MSFDKVKRKVELERIVRDTNNVVRQIEELSAKIAEKRSELTRLTLEKSKWYCEHNFESTYWFNGETGYECKNCGEVKRVYRE